MNAVDFMVIQASGNPGKSKSHASGHELTSTGVWKEMVIISVYKIAKLIRYIIGLCGEIRSLSEVSISGLAWTWTIQIWSHLIVSQESKFCVPMSCSGSSFYSA